jgi:nicotinamide-nucleotide amidase
MKSLLKKLIKKKISISVAESCTGGLLSSKITSISGASAIFNMGLITYSNMQKLEF